MEFQDTPLNIDIKRNDDLLIAKVKTLNNGRCYFYSEMFYQSKICDIL